MLKRGKSKSSIFFSSYSINRNTTENFKENYNNDALSDDMGVDVLIRQIGTEHSWPESQLKSDIYVLEKNRIHTIKDLRTLSKDSWKDIELLPIVKDLCREAISRGIPVDEHNVKRRTTLKKKSFDSLFSRSISCMAPQTNEVKLNRLKFFADTSTLKPIPDETSQKNMESKMQTIRADTSTLKPIPYNIPLTDEIKLDMQKTSADNSKFFMPPPNKKVVGDRLKVKTASGKIYEVDRWCPHSKADLSSRGIVIGSKPFCTKHKWSFDLEDGGKCISSCTDATINACAVNDW